MKRTFFITLNWNTTAMLQDMVASVDGGEDGCGNVVRGSTPEPHCWIIVENGSKPEERRALHDVLNLLFPDEWAAFSPDPTSWEHGTDVRMAVVYSPINLGLVKGHNLAFNFAQAAAQGEPFDVVLLDTDVLVQRLGWLTEVRDWVGARNVGIVGLEHAPGEVCAGAVFLDPSGNWYLHRDQTRRAEPVRGESVGLGFALLRHPVTTLRFDEQYVMYYKQDDDFCFQVRADLKMEVWAYSIPESVHYGSASLKAAGYQVNEYTGWDRWDELKRRNQAYFAKKWAWALRDRRLDLAAEAKHLAEMDHVFAKR